MDTAMTLSLPLPPSPSLKDSLSLSPSPSLSHTHTYPLSHLSHTNTLSPCLSIFNTSLQFNTFFFPLSLAISLLTSQCPG